MTKAKSFIAFLLLLLAMAFMQYVAIMALAGDAQATRERAEQLWQECQEINRESGSNEY